MTFDKDDPNTASENKLQKEMLFLKNIKNNILPVPQYYNYDVVRSKNITAHYLVIEYIDTPFTQYVKKYPNKF